MKTTYIGVVIPDRRSTREPKPSEWVKIDRFVAASLAKASAAPLE